VDRPDPSRGCDEEEVEVVAGRGVLVARAAREGDHPEEGDSRQDPQEDEIPGNEPVRGRLLGPPPLDKPLPSLQTEMPVAAGRAIPEPGISPQALLHLLSIGPLSHEASVQLPEGQGEVEEVGVDQSAEDAATQVFRSWRRDRR